MWELEGEEGVGGEQLDFGRKGSLDEEGLPEVEESQRGEEGGYCHCEEADHNIEKHGVEESALWKGKTCDARGVERRMKKRLREDSL